MALPKILLIDDNKSRIQQLEIILLFMEYEVEIASSSSYRGLMQYSQAYFGIFIGDGLEKQALLVKDVVGLAQNKPVVLVVSKGMGLQVPSMINEVVFQVMEWPASYSSFKLIADKIAEANGQFGARAATDRRVYDRRSPSIDRLKGNSTAMVEIRKLIFQVAESDATVLILGESGTGKEVVARSLHDASLRSAKPFVPINCGAIPGELLESELFGHEKGAFTGALSSRQGRFELAEGGTLFLDEIGDMPMSMQVKLLRVLQERSFERVGSNKTIHCDVRVIAATHRSLEKEIKESRFREDLFYRLNVFPIEMPALRQRAEDIPALVKDLINRLEIANRGSVRLTKAALSVLMQHTWPGNVRELANLVERLAIIYPKGLVDVADLPEKFQHYEVLEALVTEYEDVQGAEPEVATVLSTDEPVEEDLSATFSLPANASESLAKLPETGIDLKEYLNVLELDLIRQALDESHGVVAHAAKRLNMRRTTLVEKLRKYDLSR
ncbi:MAG: sigma-54 dependent transcriptional regulator [Methylococcaceae bacterium]|jgi:sigma-54 specific flagellar transcriptional regulator A